jgi:patatin-like phospholipase/acyl hydrolase
LPAAILAEFERAILNGTSAGNYFDLICGTSTGGIIALALGIGMPAQKILDIYLNKGMDVFPPVEPPFKILKQKLRFLISLAHYQYERAPLEKQLSDLWPDCILGDACRRLCIPSFDGRFGEVHVFKTPHHMDFKKDWKEKLVTVALATSAAPTIFTAYQEGYRRFLDGGVWANNPIMVGLVDALSCFDVNRRNVHILSLGCGESGFIVGQSQITGGLWHWRQIISAAMHLASQNAIGQAGLLIGRDNLLRIDAPQAPADAIQLDDYERSSRELPPIARELAGRWAEKVEKIFFSEAAEPYSAFYGPRSITS